LPLYEYACKECGTHIEKIQKFSDSPLTKCEQCGGSLKRLVSSPAIVFKGTGWYVTDYGHKHSVGASTNPTSSSVEGNEKKSEGAKKEVASATASKK